MRKIVVLIAAASVVLGLLVAGSAMSAMKKLPKTDATAVWKYITKDSPYTKWELFPGKGKLYKGKEPHGALLTTYVNKTAYDSVEKKKGMAYGSLIVKENYKPDKTLAALTIMYKVKGYNPEAGDWFWAKYLPDGKIAASEKVEACIGCHGMNKNNDYIMTAPVK